MLGYQSKIGRRQFIHEASLRYPIADSITGNGIAIHRVVLEKLHPSFKSKKIDLVIYNNSLTKAAKKSDKDLLEFYEFKLAKSGTAKENGKEHQRVFDDVVRLAYCNSWEKKDCFFLMCGTYEEFRAYFVGQKTLVVSNGKTNTVKTSTKLNPNAPNYEEWKPDGIYKDWFSFEIGESKVKVFNNANQDWGLLPFQKNYNIRHPKNTFGTSITVKTTCLAISPVGDKNKTHVAGIWKIEGS
ncbi:hypothetical protein ACI6PS_10035 [Flavobacterium sp. PLA-1-15]|uniref:hypothetical protein n=1 Tax=Flavobacterium sp. PLA-1-15 TaxID=3380533 RepID=UPI003B7DCEDD